jgi:hypothetical protein
MSARPSAELRRQVIERASSRCEYCLVQQDDAIAGHQIDHVIADKHGGPTNLENLALSCILCNLRKGSDLSSIDPDMGRVTALFNPRTQNWSEHFRVEDVRIVGVTPEGRTTVQFLQLNSNERLAERRELQRAGRFSSGT